MEEANEEQLDTWKSKTELIKRGEGISYRGQTGRMQEVNRSVRSVCELGIFPRRDLVSRFIARVVPTSMLGERDPLLAEAATLRQLRKEEKVG